MITIRFTGETSKMSWAALPVEPACMGKAIIGAAEMRKCLDKIFDLAIDERLK